MESIATLIVVEPAPVPAFVRVPAPEIEPPIDSAPRAVGRERQVIPVQGNRYRYKSRSAKKVLPILSSRPAAWRRLWLRLIPLETVKFPLVKIAAGPPAASPKMIGTVDGPAAPLVVPELLIPTFTTPRLIVNPPVKVFAADKVRDEFALFSTTPVTFVPMT